MRLIDADAVLAEIIKGNSHQVGDYTITFDYGAAAAINNAPTIDAEPVRHGRWVYGDDVDIQCSACGKDAMSDWMKYTQVYSPYCPWCGAKMDAKDGDRDAQMDSEMVDWL